MDTEWIGVLADACVGVFFCYLNALIAASHIQMSTPQGCATH